MDHSKDCDHSHCTNSNASVCQTISEMDWERGLWYAGIFSCFIIFVIIIYVILLFIPCSTNMTCVPLITLSSTYSLITSSEFMKWKRLWGLNLLISTS